MVHAHDPPKTPPMVLTAFLVVATDLFTPVVALDTMTVDHARG